MNSSEEKGGKTSYYGVTADEDGCVDVDRIAKELGLTFAEGNIIKAIFGIAISRMTGESRHGGTDTERDINKAKHYVKLLK